MTMDPDLLSKEEEEKVDDELLGKEEAKLFRGIAARLNYMGPDRPDMQYAIKEAARCMANPRRCDWGLLKKLGRYLIFRPRLILRYDWQKRQSSIDGYTDSDWGGCTQSRKSTSGAVMMVGRHVIKSYSKQQKVLALSSAEAETYGMVACSAELLGIQACAKDMGMDLEGVVYADASAALGIVQRRGVGKVRHIRTQALWLQEAHATKRLGYEKIDGARNPSDLMTKHLADTLQQRHPDFMNVQSAAGRAESAPTLGSLDHDRYLLGTLQENRVRGILKKKPNMHETQESEWEQQEVEVEVRTPYYDAPDSRRRPEHFGKFCRRKSVTFSPLVSTCNIIPYAEVYGQHPREFVFDASGRKIANDASPLEIHARETRIEGTATAQLNSLVKLSHAAHRSLEEEFEETSCRVRMGRQSGTIHRERCTDVQTAVPQCDGTQSVGYWLKSLLVHAPPRSRVPAGES